VWGPALVSSFNNYRYFVHFADDHSKFIWIYFLTQKPEVFDVFTKFKSMVETQFDTKIKSLQTRWGEGEYRNVFSFPQKLLIPSSHHETCLLHPLKLLWSSILPVQRLQVSTPLQARRMCLLLATLISLMFPLLPLYHPIPWLPDLRLILLSPRACY